MENDQMKNMTTSWSNRVFWSGMLLLLSYFLGVFFLSLVHH
jgi:hypothetical protein